MDPPQFIKLSLELRFQRGQVVTLQSDRPGESQNEDESEDPRRGCHELSLSPGMIAEAE